MSNFTSFFIGLHTNDFEAVVKLFFSGDLDSDLIERIRVGLIAVKSPELGPQEMWEYREVELLCHFYKTSPTKLFQIIKRMSNPKSFCLDFWKFAEQWVQNQLPQHLLVIAGSKRTFLTTFTVL